MNTAKPFVTDRKIKGVSFDVKHMHKWSLIRGSSILTFEPLVTERSIKRGMFCTLAMEISCAHFWEVDYLKTIV